MIWLRRRLPFDLTPWPNRREAPPANYAFFSALSLAVTLRPMTTIFRSEAALAPRPATPFSALGSERVFLVTGRPRLEIWRSFRLLCEGLQEAGLRRGPASTAPAFAGGMNLPVVGKPLDSLIKTTTDHAPRAASHATTATQFSRIAKFFNERPVSASPGPSQNFETGVGRNDLAVNPGSVSERNGWRPMTSRQNAANLGRADGLIARHPGAAPVLKLSILTTQASADEQVAPQFLPAIYLTRSDSKRAPFNAGNVFTSPQLTLAARPAAGRETPAPGASTSDPTALQYARREAQLARGFSDALRDLRQSLINDRRPAAPPPAPQIDQLTSQVYDQLKRELRIERERRGL